MSMTIEDVVGIARRFAYGSRMEWPEPELRAALLALVAQARDEEAEACALQCEEQSRYYTPYPGAGATGCAAAIRARIAGRKA